MQKTLDELANDNPNIMNDIKLRKPSDYLADEREAMNEHYQRFMKKHESKKKLSSSIGSTPEWKDYEAELTKFHEKLHNDFINNPDPITPDYIPWRDKQLVK